MNARIAAATAASLFALVSPVAAVARDGRLDVPASFMVQALCVHSGWHYEAARGVEERRRLQTRYGRPPDYWQGPVAFYRTWDVSDRVKGGSGEGGWTSVSSSYGGGLQFTLGTWNGAAGRSRGLVSRLASTAAIAAERPAVQIYAAWLVVTADHGSWREWPQTSRACGLR